MFDEEALERMTMEELNGIGYKSVKGGEILRDYAEVLLTDVLEESLKRLNKDITAEQIVEAIRQLKHLDQLNPTLNNKLFTKCLIEGIKVAEQINGETRYKTVRLIDFKNVENNDFKAVNQYTIKEHSEKRPDIILFVNGLPLVIIELKSTVREDVHLSDAYRQLKGYQEVHIPSLFHYNQILIISDGVTAKAGTITSQYSRFNEWKKINDTDKITENMATHITLIHGMLSKERLLDIIQNFILFSENNKILSAYHQYFGVKRSIINTLNAKDGKAGIIWHTQGSGKSFSMVFYVGNMITKMDNPTIVVVTDRNDLDGQLFSTFLKCNTYLKQDAVRAEGREDLTEKLENRKAGGIIFTTLQKFEEETGLYSTRDNILVLVDEAHRSHYGLEPDIKINKQTLEATKKYGMAKYLHEALPNAIYIGFTGTPVETKDKSTSNIFGDVIDVYDMTQSIMDGATVPIVYEARMARVGLNQKILDKIDEYYTYLERVEEVDEIVVLESQKAMSKMSKIIEDPDILGLIVNDIINHYEERKHLVANKAMVVAYSRKSAYIMYQKFLELKPELKDNIRMIITPSNKDPEEMQKIIGSRKDKADNEVEFKDPDSNFTIAIVVDMWLTGFDVPSLGTMYVDKPMKAHTLMQAIARVNRVYKDKEGGLIVDYIGLKKWLLEALKVYTKRDQEKVIDNAELIKVLNDKIELIRNLFYGFEYKDFASISDKEKYMLIQNGANHVLKDEETKNRFMKNSYDTKNLYSLCTGVLSEEQKEEILYFISVRSFISKILGEKPDIKEINEHVAKLLEEAIQEDELLVLGELNNSKQFSLLNTEILNKLQNMKNKNIAADVLAQALKGYVKQVGKTNLVLMEKFSVKFNKIAIKYNERVNVEDIEKIIQEMINLKNEIEEEMQKGNEFNLSVEEKAFFDALGKDPEIKELMQDEVLVQIAKELVITIHENMTLDWDIRSDARARMRREIKMLLIDYNYPPIKADEAIHTVVKQVELQCKNIIE